MTHEEQSLLRPIAAGCPDIWPPPQELKPNHGGFSAGDVVYVRMKIDGFDARGNAFCRPVNKGGIAYKDAAAWYALSTAWLVRGPVVKQEMGL